MNIPERYLRKLTLKIAVALVALAALGLAGIAFSRAAAKAVKRNPSEPAAQG